MLGQQASAGTRGLDLGSPEADWWSGGGCPHGVVLDTHILTREGHVWTRAHVVKEPIQRESLWAGRPLPRENKGGTGRRLLEQRASWSAQGCPGRGVDYGSGPHPEPDLHSSTQLASRPPRLLQDLTSGGQTDAHTPSLPPSVPLKTRAAEKPSSQEMPTRGLVCLLAQSKGPLSVVADTPRLLAPHVPLARAPAPVRWAWSATGGSHTHKRQLGPTQDHLLPLRPWAGALERTCTGPGTQGRNSRRGTQVGLTSGDLSLVGRKTHTPGDAEHAITLHFLLPGPCEVGRPRAARKGSWASAARRPSPRPAPAASTKQGYQGVLGRSHLQQGSGGHV